MNKRGGNLTKINETLQETLEKTEMRGQGCIEIYYIDTEIYPQGDSHSGFRFSSLSQVLKLNLKT